MTTEPSSEAVEPSPQSAKRRPMLARSVVVAINLIWFFGYLVFLSVLPSATADASAWLLLIIIVGGLTWLASAFWIYDTLFKMAEARWPAVKRIREIVSPLLPGLLFPHHHK